MRRRRLFWQVFPLYLLVTLATLGAATWYFSSAVRDFFMEQVARELKARASVVAAQVEERLAADRLGDIDAVCKNVGKRSATRITVIADDGRVLGDSDESPERMENHADRPEFRDVLARPEGSGRAVRPSGTLQKDMMYVAVAARSGNRVRAVVRAALPLTAIDDSLRGILGRIALGAAVAAAAALLVTLAVSRSISRPLEEMRRGAERFAAGDLKARLRAPPCEELARLANALNQSAAQLDERIHAIVRSGNEHEAILSSMAEGVVAVDADERLMSLNRAAARMLGVRQAEAIGRTILEVTRDTELQKFISAALGSLEPVETDFALSGEDERFLHARGTPLRDAAGQRVGAVIVLSDVTRMRKLESVRRDFVANVSHELKTPITSIQGFVETLRDGALEDREKAHQFLEIIANHTDRLAAIIDDLLLLSRVERDAEQNLVAVGPERIGPVLLAAVEACQPAAADKHIEISVDCPESLEASVNALLLRQAVSNLVDNAVKYSEPEHPVHVAARADGADLVISVRDAGCGIEAEHLPRIFERFYRVDKGRSRDSGGTGLGLSIVKHIVQAHCGSISVESVPGSGSVFTIRLPLCRPPSARSGVAEDR